MMKSFYWLAVALLVTPGARADTLEWDHSTGWNKGFVLTIDTEKALVKLQDRNSNKTWSRTMNNPVNSLRYLESLMKKIPGKSIGRASDDGPVNLVTLTKKEGSLVRRIYDVAPPGAIFVNKDYSAEVESGKAGEFLKSVDGFLLMSQLEILKTSYFDNPKALWWAEEKSEADKKK